MGASNVCQELDNLFVNASIISDIKVGYEFRLLEEAQKGLK